MLLLVMRVTNDYSQNDDDDDRNHAGRRTATVFHDHRGKSNYDWMTMIMILPSMTMMTTLMKLMLMRDLSTKQESMNWISAAICGYTIHKDKSYWPHPRSSVFQHARYCQLTVTCIVAQCCTILFNQASYAFSALCRLKFYYVPHLSPNSVLWGLSEHIWSTPRSMHSARERPQRPKLPKWRSPDGVRHRGRLCGCLYTTCDSMSEVAKIPTRGGCIFAICMLPMWKIKCTNCSCVLWGSLLLSLSFRLGLLAKSTWYCFAIQNDVTCWYGAVLCAFEALLAKPSAQKSKCWNRCRSLGFPQSLQPGCKSQVKATTVSSVSLVQYVQCMKSEISRNDFHLAQPHADKL